MRSSLLAFGLALSLFSTTACRDEAPPAAPPPEIRANVELGDFDVRATMTTPSNACAHLPHLVIVSAEESTLSFGMARALAPELIASGEVASARPLPGGGDEPPQLTLVIDTSGLWQSEQGSELRVEGSLSFELVSADALGGLARRIPGRLPRPTFETTLTRRFVGKATAPSPQLAREALAREAAPELARQLADMLEAQRTGLPYCEDPAPLRVENTLASPKALDRSEIARLGAGQDHTGAIEVIYRVRGDSERAAFVLDLMASLQKEGFRTLSRRKGEDSQVLAMRDDLRHVQLTVRSEDPVSGPFQGFLVLNQAPSEEQRGPRFDRIAAGEAPLPALMALRRDLGPDRFPALIKTLGERRDRQGLGPRVLLALAEMQRNEGDLEGAGLSYRQASHAAWLLGEKESAFPGTDALVRNLGLEGDPVFASASGSAAIAASMTRVVPRDGELEVPVPTGDAAFIPLRIESEGAAEARVAVLVVTPKWTDGSRYRLYMPSPEGRPARRLAGALGRSGGETFENEGLHWTISTEGPDQKTRVFRFRQKN